MERRRFGTTDMWVSPLGFGGSEIGFERVDEKSVSQLLGDALDAGLNVIDSAAAYLESESLIGKAVSHRRKDYYLFTKCGAVDGFSRSDWTKAGILATLHGSLQRLRTEYVDLLQLHSCGVDVLKSGEAVAALLEAKAAGLTRYIGYSGDGEAARIALDMGVFDALQTSVNVADQEALTLTVPTAQKLGVGVIAKRPIANAAWKTGVLPENSYHHSYFRRLNLLEYPWLQGSLASAAATALRFTVFQSGVHTAIVGTTKSARFMENLNAVGLGPLDPQLVDEIRERFNAVGADWPGQT